MLHDPEHGEGRCYLCGQIECRCQANMEDHAMGRINSKRKGKVGELELCHALERIFGCEAVRGQQYKGAADSPDVCTSIAGVHWECKRCERLNIYAAVAQADYDRGLGDVPVVAHRRNGEEWLAIVRLGDLPELARRLYKPERGE